MSFENINGQEDPGSFPGKEFILSKTATEHDLENLKNELKAEGLEVRFEDLKYNEEKKITSIFIEYKDAQGNSGKYNLKGSHPIADISISLKEGSVSIRSIREETSSDGSRNYSDTFQSFEKSERSRDFIMERRERQRERRARMEIKRDSIRAKMRTEYFSDNESSHYLIKADFKDSDLNELKETFKKENIDFQYKSLARDDNGIITAITIKVMNNKGISTSSSFGNGKDSIPDIEIRASEKMVTIKGKE